MITKNKFQFILLHFILFAFYLFYFYNKNNPTSDDLKLMGVFGWIQLLLSYYSWKCITGKLFVPYIVFLTAAYAFTFGQSFLDVFGFVDERRSLIRQCDIAEIYEAQFYTLLFMMVFHLGGLVSFKQNVLNNSFFNNQINILEQQSIKKIGVVLLIISTIPFIIKNIYSLMIVSTYGYIGLYDENLKIPGGAVITFFSDYFIPGMLCMLLASKRNRLKRMQIILTLALFVLVIMYCGGRSQGVVLVAIILLYYHNFIKALSLKKWVIVGLLSILFVSSLSAVAHLRSGTRDNYFTSVINYQSETNPFFETISEMGASMYPMARTISLIPSSEDYRYGATYAYAISSIIPNIGFWERHPAAINAMLSEWLMEKDNLSYGPGYSIVAEAYINFGKMGFVAMFIIGFFFCKLLTSYNGNKYSLLSLLIALIFTYMSLKMVRNEFLATVRIAVFYIFPIYLYVNYQVRKNIGKMKLRN